jgi:hypothetical protein
LDPLIASAIVHEFQCIIRQILVHPESDDGLGSLQVNDSGTYLLHLNLLRSIFTVNAGVISFGNRLLSTTFESLTFSCYGDVHNRGIHWCPAFASSAKVSRSQGSRVHVGKFSFNEE